MSEPTHADVEDSYLPVTIEHQEISFKNFRKVETFNYREDASGIRATREIVSGKHAVAIVVYDPNLDKLVMIRQFRLGAQLGTDKGMTVEFAAGMIDEGEQPQATALRELTEETGLHANHIEPLCSFLTTPGMTDEVLHLFYAEADASNLAEAAGVEGETEQTFPFLVSFEDAMEAVDTNALHNGIVMVGLLWFARHKTKLTSQSR